MLKPVERVALTAEDRQKFKAGCKTANPAELLTIAAFVEDHAARFTEKDLRFMRSQIGQRCERLLRNVVKNFSFDD